MKLAIALIFWVLAWLAFNAFLAVRLGVVAALISTVRNRFKHRPPEITREIHQPR